MPSYTGRMSDREGAVARKACLQNEPIRSANLIKMNRDPDRNFEGGVVC
jgi:hypothetical protein